MNIFSQINQFINRVKNFISFNLDEKPVRYAFFFSKSMHQNLKSPGKNSGSEPRAVGFNSGVKGLIIQLMCQPVMAIFVQPSWGFSLPPLTLVIMVLSQKIESCDLNLCSADCTWNLILVPKG